MLLLQYGINDSVEILLAPAYWMLAGFGTRLDQPTSIVRHERLQHWSIEVLARRAEQLLGLRLDIDPASAAALTPGPVIVLCRHVNIVDASLPTLLYQRLGYRTRGVIMAELLADPGFDLIYGRTASPMRTPNGPHDWHHSDTSCRPDPEASWRSSTPSAPMSWSSLTQDLTSSHRSRRLPERSRFASRSA